MAGYVPVLLITANVGSIFEEPGVMLNIWTEEFLATIARLDPKFIALHCQEVGGKNYEQSMRHVEYFVRLLMSSEELRLFDKVRVFLDEDFSSAEHFTALGNFYFVHESLKDVLIWDFKESSFVPVSGKEVHSGNIEAVTTKEKAKFPQDFFPECKWSRKGFLRTRWSISGTVFDLINIHLFHDASNFIAMETFPSVYSKTRRRALEHTLDRFHNDQYVNVPYFLFGDFNFRTDTAGVIKKLTEDTQESKLPNQNNFSKLQFHNKDDDLILTLGKKEFSHFKHQHMFMNNSAEWLREYDRELEDFEGRLLEFPINFLPSYPFEENIKEGSNYMKTRVPAWCDRVLLSPTAKTLADQTSTSGAVEYGIIGPTTCMGDHKPVYLRLVLLSDAGTVNCCRLANAPQFCFQVPDSFVDTLSLLPDCRSYLSKAVHTEHSANLLHAAPVKHDPYTPDSMDSPSPRVLAVTGEVPDIDLMNNINEEIDEDVDPAHRISSASKRVNMAVSPALLKSKLELIVRSKSRDANDSRLKVDDDIEITKNLIECDLENDAKSAGVKKERRSSDVSWQRSHLLTRAWVQGRGHQSYDSFHSNLTRRSFSSSDSMNLNDVAPDMVIPRIAIINPSNFESNESSVHLHDDRQSCSYSETRLSSYSDNRTKTISGEASSLEKSNEITSSVFQERGDACLDMKTNLKNIQDTTSQDQNIYVSVTELGVPEKLTGTYLLDDCSISSNIDTKFKKLEKTNSTAGTPKEQDTFDAKSMSKDNNNQYILEDEKLELLRSGKEGKSQIVEANNDSGEKKLDQKSTILNEDGDYKCSNSITEKNDCSNIGTDTMDLDKSQVEDKIKSETSEKPKIFESQRSDINVINENLNTYVSNTVSSNEVDLPKQENCEDILSSRNTTRSNSTQSQDGKVRLRLKAHRVTEKCKNDIAKEKGKCKRCCCTVS